MIEYFVRPLGGVRSAVTRTDVARFAAQPHMGFRARPAGVVTGALDEGTLDLVSAYLTARPLAPGPLKFTVTSPYMLARTLLDEHYGDLRALALAIAEVLAAQVREIDADVLQVDEARRGCSAAWPGGAAGQATRSRRGCSAAWPAPAAGYRTAQEAASRRPEPASCAAR